MKIKLFVKLGLVVFMVLVCFASENMSERLANKGPFPYTNEVKNFEQAAKKAGLLNNLPIEARERNGQMIFRLTQRQDNANPYEASGFFDANGKLKAILLSGARDSRWETFSKSTNFLRKMLLSYFNLKTEEAENLLRILVNYWLSGSIHKGFKENYNRVKTEKYVFVYGHVPVYTVVCEDIFEVKIDTDPLYEESSNK